jgi:hypothetical protein
MDISDLERIIDKLDSVDDTFHIEKMCELEETLRKTLTKKQSLYLDVLLSMYAAHEQRAGRAILLDKLSK